MDTVTTEARRPGRPRRDEVTKTERRRRKGGTVDKLAIPDHIKAKYSDMEFRWARDDGARIYTLTEDDDWDKVPEVKPIHGGRGEAGTGMKMHLLMKPRAFLEEDRAERAAANRAHELEQLARPEKAQALEQGADIYSVPGNKL